MKILFDYCSLKHYTDGDTEVKFGIGWYKHHKSNKWWGFTIQFYFMPWLFNVTYVDNWKEYDKKINYWRHRRGK